MELSEIQKADLSQMKASELADQLAIMAGEGKPADMSQNEYNEIVRKVVEAYNKARKAETSLAVIDKTKEPKEEALSEEEFARNAITLNKYEAQTSVGEEFKSVFDRIDIVEGKKSLGVNLSNEVFEAAKLGVSVNSVTDKQPLSQQEYNERLQSEIAEILSTMILTKPVNEKTNETETANDVTDANDRAKELANIFDPNFKGKVKVSNTVAGATFATYLGRVATKAEELMPKYNKGKNKGFFSNLKDKFNKLDQAVTNKLKQKYQESKAVVTTMIQNGTWKEAALGLGLGATAFLTAGTMVGVGAAAGLTAMTAVQTYRRGKEFWNGYKAAKAKNKKVNFGNYTLDNWKDAAKVVLYAGATVAGGAATYYNYLATAAKTAGDAATIATAADTAKTASFGKLGLITTATSGTHVADSAAALAKGDFKQAGSSAKKAAFGIVGMGLAYWLGSDNSAHANELPAHEAPTLGDGHGPVNMEEAFAKGLFDANGNAQGDWLDVNSNPEAADIASNMADTTYSVEPAGAKEMAIYTRNLKFVPDSDIMVANIKDGLIQIPDGMSPEEAVNIARIQSLNYGNHDLLTMLKDCDGNQYDLREVLKNIHDNSWTTVGKGHNLGDLKDFVGDNCRHGIIKQIDCDGNVKIKVINTCPDCKPVIYDNEVINKPVPVDPDTPVAPSKPDTPVKPTDPINLPENNKAELSNAEFRHVNSDADAVSTQAGEQTFNMKSTPATEADIKSNPVSGQSAQTTGDGLLRGKDGKPLNMSFGHSSGSGR